GKAVVDSLPEGVIPALVYTKGPGETDIPLAAQVTVARNIALPVPPFYNWGRSLKLGLNTSASGAPTTGDVKDFPLLVRLSAPAFDFSLARGDGRDLRFSAPDGEVLSPEIETFDSAAGRADIWVRVPVVRGNDPAQFITLHWGNPD